jgi:hypothetical protein
VESDSLQAKGTSNNRGARAAQGCVEVPPSLEA